MSKGKAKPSLVFGQVRTTEELGQIMRAFRKSQLLTLETVSGLSHLSMRFLSELERGKETAEIGKALQALNKLGLEVLIQPRGYEQQKRREFLKLHLLEGHDDK
jgi:HTH-type transcriptional regulator/antitoxin HipB